MAEQGTIHSPTPRPKTTTSGPFLSFNLDDEIEKLRSESTWQAGKNSKTLIKYSDYRIVLIALHGGARMTEHHAAGRISMHTVSGRIKVHTAGSEFDMPAGRLLVLDRAVPHDIEAIEESAFIVTIAWPEQRVE